MAAMVKAVVPRIARGQQGGYADHVINRGNGRATVFHKSQDYEAFVSLLAEAKRRHPVKLFGFCLMPNHAVDRAVPCR
jgi:putative transposase